MVANAELSGVNSREGAQASRPTAHYAITDRQCPAFVRPLCLGKAFASA